MLAANTIITVVDFETTGVVGDHPAEPWQIGFVQLVNGQVDPATCRDSLLRTNERPFNRYAPGRWHELRAEIRNAPLLTEHLPEFRPALFGSPLVAHNLATERTILQRYCPLHQPPAWLDTLPLAKHAWPGLGSYALEALLEVLQLRDQTNDLCPDREPHDALFDAVGTALLLQLLLTLPGWQQASISDLERLSAAAPFSPT